MSTQPEYASRARVFTSRTNVGNTARDGSGALALAALSTWRKTEASRIDRLGLKANAATAAGTIRFYLVKGVPGEEIDTIQIGGSVVTVTTKTDHCRRNGDKVTLQDVYPEEFNVVDAVITVTNPKTFQFTLTGTLPTKNAQEVGGYSVTVGSPQITLWREVFVSAVPGLSAIVQTAEISMNSAHPADQGFLPLILPAGWQLRWAPHNAESFDCTVPLGDTRK